MRQNSINSNIAHWLFLSSFMVIIMVFIGGITRLTNSGLSIVEWKPITGILPPLNHKSWLIELAKYQLSPEFQKINYNIDLTHFKFIYLMEYIHRLLGRITMLIFILPFIYFWYKKYLSKAIILKITLILALGIAQGFAGWYMVKSGLKYSPHVSQYLLALHLTIAFIIYGSLLWLGFTQLNKHHNKIGSYRIFTIFTLLIQIITGAFVAGLKAGLTYNTYPLMDGKLIPSRLFILEPWYRNIFENVTTVQFIHRWLAIIIAINLFIFMLRCNRNNSKLAVKMLLLSLITQIALGITTLIYHVPIFIASLHQIGAVAIFSIALYLIHKEASFK